MAAGTSAARRDIVLPPFEVPVKIPTRILGLLVATVAAPVIAGCAGEVADDGPTNTTESNLQRQEPPKEEAQPASANAPPAESAPSAAPAQPEEPEQPEQPEDPCPPCGMG
jgi:hypothetical protein